MRIRHTSPRFRKGIPCLLFFLLLSVLHSYGQSTLSAYDVSTGFRDYWPASVPASGLFRKPAEEMDYATGRATVRIPLYEIRTADFVLPVSISFVTGDIDDNRPSGPLGAGWQLDAEPMITRQVRGAPDEFHFLADSAVRHASDTRDYRLRLATGQADVQEDIFHYRLLSGSSSFILEESARRYFRPRLLTREPVVVSVPSGRVTPGFGHSISVTDASGNRYLFGGESSSRELTLQGSGEAVTSWKASEIVSVHGDRIRFSYWDKAPQEYPSSRYDFYQVEDGFRNQTADNLGGIPPHPGYWKGVNGRKNYYYVSGTQPDPVFGTPSPVFTKWDKVTDVPYSMPGSRVTPRPLQRVDFSGGSVRFSYGARTGLLERMDVYAGDRLLRSVRFTLTDTYLPFLSRVETFGSDGKSAGSYRLGYTSYREGATDDEYTRRIGTRSTGSMDDRVPTRNVTIDSGTDNRTLTFSLGNGGNTYFPDYRGEHLCFIIYPSGGRTEYAYQHGYAHTPASGSVYAGTRLSSITDHPVCGLPVVRQFRYGDSESLNGVGYARFPADPSAFLEEYSKHYVLTDVLGRQSTVSGRCRLYCNRNMVSGDASVYYPFVRESVNGVHTLRHFPCYSPYGQTSSVRHPDPIGYGPVISRPDSCLYLQQGHAFSVRHSTWRSGWATVGGLRITALFENTGDLSGGGTGQEPVRDLYRYSFLENQVEVYQTLPGEQSHDVRSLDGNDVSVRSESRTCSSSGLLRSITTDRERVEFSYPGDLPSVPGHARMTALNVRDTPVETCHYVDGTLRRRLVYDYEPDAKSSCGYSLSSVRGSSSSGSPLRTLERYLSRLPCGKPSEVVRQDGVTVGIVWAYGGLHPVAFVEGMGSAALLSAGIPLESLSSSHAIPESVYTSLDRLRASRPDVRVTTFRYLPMVGLVKRTAPDGTSGSYSYDPCGRLSEIKNHQQKNITTYEYHEAN